jgi:hypothetical protein
MTDIDKPATARKASKPRAASVRAKPASTSHAASRKKAATKTATKTAATKTAAVAPISEASALHRAPAITRRVQLAIARELARIEAIIDDPSAPLAHSDAERTARTLATLARTLKEITQLGVLKKKAKANKTSSGKSKSKHDESMPRDLDEFRRELAQRLDALVAGSAPASLERNDGD